MAPVLHARLRVALSAAPPLLLDTLRSHLEDVLTDVSIVLTEENTGDVFDLAIVTNGSPQPAAELTVVLDDAPTARGGGAIHGATGHRVGDLEDLAALVGFVSGLAGDRAQR
jgi:hypothetical protein